MNILAAFETFLVVKLYILCNEEYQVQAKQSISGEAFGGIYENELDHVESKDKIVSFEYERNNKAITNENIDTIMSILLESKKANVAKMKENDAKNLREMEISRRNNLKTNDKVASLNYNTRLNENVDYKKKGYSLADYRNNIIDTEENFISVEYDPKGLKQLEYRSRNNSVELHDKVVSMDFYRRSNGLTESRRDNIKKSHEIPWQYTKTLKKYKKGKIQQHDKSIDMEKRRRKMMNADFSAEREERKKLFDIVVHIKV
ncbi:uncharacterized protein LOC125238469 [Leguminivora glycinivorella]|uniref:uncharacterized protein LOC125238469 n=1 Tax=Leguminivora glycinivorella TaxID=1035111 RepID=UPI00200D28B6|nr:uncharacterized protein LOC125238469 [Leguminivora glycinivorella]